VTINIPEFLRLSPGANYYLLVSVGIYLSKLVAGLSVCSASNRLADNAD